MEQSDSTPIEATEPEAQSPDLLKRLQGWCEDLQRRLPGLVEVGLLRLDGETAGRIAAVPETMPMERMG